MIYSNNTYDITQDISTYTRIDFQTVYDTSRSKWYMLNNGVYVENPVQAAAPSITNVWPSKWYHNSTYMHKLYRNDSEQAILNYMSDEKFRKGKVQEQYNTNAYIQFPASTSYNNSPRFETNLYLKNTYTIEMKFKTPESNSNWRQVIGAYNGNNINTGNCFAIYTNANGSNIGINYWNYRGYRQYNDNALPITANTLYTLIINVGTGNAVLNGISYSGSGNNATGTLSRVFQIGSVQMNLNDSGFNGKIYYIKITEDDNLIAYYEANNDDNTPGFLDRVTNIKYTNSGGGSASYGEDE